MADLNTLAGFIDDPVVYFRFDSNIDDFTKKYNGRFIVSTPKHSASFTAEEIGLYITPHSFLYALWYNVFCKNHTVFTWDIKKFISHLRYHLKSSITLPEASVIDLKYGSAYQGRREEKQPKSFVEAAELAKSLVRSSSWQLAASHLHNPLSFETLPELENKPLVDDVQKTTVYSFYEVEGQTNGRLSTHKLSNKFFPVHSLAPEQKESLLPRHFLDDDWMFVLLDYQQMEVSVLAWLAKDDVLRSALDNVDEFYTSVATFPCLEEKRREIGKSIFLPLIYGMQAKSLSERLKLEQSAVDKVIEGLKTRFPKSFQWIEDRESDTNPIAVDYFGRKRDFSKEPKYKRRNFEVQSPASFVCLERLCKLQKTLPEYTQMSIHDGYGLVVKKQNFVDVVRTAKNVLESPSQIFPDLRLKVSCQVGKKLNEMRKINVPS